MARKLLLLVRLAHRHAHPLSPQREKIACDLRVSKPRHRGPRGHGPERGHAGPAHARPAFALPAPRALVGARNGQVG
eukprot:3311321-Rhodomonas_salina.4